MESVGKSVERVDVQAKVLGEAQYPGDINMSGQLYMKILFAGRPHAIIHNIDTTAAEALPGVLAVFTARDVPRNEYGLGTPDQPVLCGPGSAKPFADRVRWVGDQIALVVAESDDIASRARDLIQVKYEDLPALTDPEAAMRDDAMLLHPERESNIFVHYRIRKGDVDKGFTAADVIIEGEYHTPIQEHAYLQPEAGIAYMDEEGRVTVKVAGQWTHEDQEQIAHALDLPLEKVRVIYPAIGGAFGGREDMSVQIVLALAAWRLSQRGINRPVKVIWSREESIIGHHKRHPFIIKTKWGATRDGVLVAADVEVIADGGGYIYTTPKVLGNATLMCTGPYDIPNVRVDSYGVYTNNVVTGAFRGFGGPQGAFAAEIQMDRLAEALGMDRVQLRLRNVLREGTPLSVDTPLPKGVSLPQVIETCAEASGWKVISNESKTARVEPGRSPHLPQEPASPHIKRGVGFAAAYKNIGFSFGAAEQCTATVELHGKAEIDRVVVYHAAAEVGQGVHTVISQAAAEAAGVPVEKVSLVVSDTATTANAGSVSASRMTFMALNSVKGAAEAAKEKWNNEERPAIATYQYRAPKTTPFDPQTGKSMPNFAYGYVAETVVAEVDCETGEIHLLNVTCVDDVGRAINPQQVIGQIEGAVVQAAGYSLMENFLQHDGFVQTERLSTYLIPTVLDIPDKIDAIIMEYPDPNGPWGGRGMGEMPFLPLAPAIVDAVHDATGVWFFDFPLTPEKVLRGLGKLN